MTIFASHQQQNQGQQIALNWSNQSALKNITALLGTDGKIFLPVSDRGQYSPGVIRALPTGGIYYAGLPTVVFVHPWLSDGQLETLKTYRGNVTIRHHIEDSVGKTDVQTSNAIYNMDLNQLAGLERKADGWVDFVSNFIITEVI